MTCIVRLPTGLLVLALVVATDWHTPAIQAKAADIGGVLRLASTAMSVNQQSLEPEKVYSTMAQRFRATHASCRPKNQNNIDSAEHCGNVGKTAQTSRTCCCKIDGYEHCVNMTATECRGVGRCE